MYAIIMQHWTPGGWQSQTLGTYEDINTSHDALRREVNLFLKNHPSAACRTLNPYQADIIERFGIMDSALGEMYQFLNVLIS